MCALSVDRIGSPSVTMISTTSLEPGNPVTAELSWKTVKKGHRSATRRPRKINQSLNVCMHNNDKGSEEEPSATESEEFGLAVLGHRFCEKIDHLPIKKRRSMQHSPPSPPHIPFDKWCGKAGALVDGLLPVQTSSHNEKSAVNRKPPCSEDSYGIELLAATACNTSLTDEILNVKEVKVEQNFEALPQTADASIRVTLSEETIAAVACNISRTGEVFNVKAVKVEEKTEVFPQSDSSINVTSLEETIICSQKQNSLLNDITSVVAHDGSRDQNNSPAIQVKSDDIICSQKQNSLLKDINSVAHDDSRDQNHYPVVSGVIHDKSDIICSPKQNSLLKDISTVAHDDSGDQNNSSAISEDIHDESDIICSQKQNSLLKDINSVSHDNSSDQNDSPSVFGHIHDTSGIEAVKGSSSEKCVRLHWDLNTVMDDWELPPENMNTNSPRNVSVDVHNEGIPCGETEKLGSGAQHDWELVKCSSEVEASARVMDASKCSDSGLFPGSDPIASETFFKEEINSPNTKMAVKVEEYHILGSDLQLGQTVAIENVQLKKQYAAMVNSTISDKTFDVVRINSLSDFPNDKNTTNLMETALDVGGPSCKSEKAGPSFEKGVDLVGKININGPSEIDPPVGSSAEFQLKKLDIKSCMRSGEAVVEDFLDDGDVSDYSPGGHYHFVRFDKMSKYKSGCESPVEDGELRESIAYSWQENENETDCVDYDMDDRDAIDDFAVGYNSVSKAGSSSNQIDSNVKLVEKATSGKIDFPKELNHSTTIGKSSGWDQIPKGCERVAKTIEANNGNLSDIGALDSTQKLDGKGSLEEKVESRPTRGKISTRLQRLSGSGTFDGKATRDEQRSSSACFQDGHMYHFERYIGRDRADSRMSDGSQRNSQDSDVSRKWDSRNHYQNGYQRGGGNSRLRNNDNPDANDDDLAYNDHHRPSRGNFLRGGYRPFVRRSPDDDNHNSPNRGNFATSNDSHYRSRGRSGFYRRGFAKGNRNEFHDPIADDSPPPSVRVPHNHSDRRKYSPSPIYIRDNSFSRPSRKSPSLSRSRSPVPWHLQREKNGGRRQISRSPDFRSEGRMGIKRMHYDDPKFSENDDGFLSPSRRGFSNDRKSGPTCYKDRDSPGRFFGQRQRFGSNGIVGRMGKDDDGFRPRLNSERFSEQSGGGWRAHSNSDNNNYNDNSDSQRTRYNNKPKMIGRVRHSETSGTDRRFRSDADDLLERHYTRNEYNNNNKSSGGIRSIEKIDALGNSWEGGKRHFKRDSGRIYTSSSKLHGIREFEDGVSASRG